MAQNTDICGGSDMQASEMIALRSDWDTPDWDLGGRLMPDGTIRWLLDTQEPDSEAFALAIICLTSPDLFPGRLLLQLRGPHNSSSAHGKYSNVSGRVTRHDHLQTGGSANTLGEEVFLIAAMREVFEETGISLDSELFKRHDAFRQPISGRVADCRVFHVALDLRRLAGCADASCVARWLREKELFPFSRSEVAGIVESGRANTVLSVRLHETFTRLFDPPLVR